MGQLKTPWDNQRHGCIYCLLPGEASFEFSGMESIALVDSVSSSLTSSSVTYDLSVTYGLSALFKQGKIMLYSTYRCRVSSKMFQELSIF